MSVVCRYFRATVFQGNCTTAPPAALDPERLGTVLTPEPWRAPRCLIIVTDSPFVIDEAHLWVDSVHVQILLDRELDPRAALIFPDGALFMTDSVVQGSDNVGGTALSASGAKRGAYFNGVPACPPACMASTHTRPAVSLPHECRPESRASALRWPQSMCTNVQCSCRQWCMWTLLSAAFRTIETCQHAPGMALAYRLVVHMVRMSTGVWASSGCPGDHRVCHEEGMVQAACSTH